MGSLDDTFFRVDTNNMGEVRKFSNFQNLVICKFEN